MVPTISLASHEPRSSVFNLALKEAKPTAVCDHGEAVRRKPQPIKGNHRANLGWRPCFLDPPSPRSWDATSDARQRMINLMKEIGPGNEHGSRKMGR
jgi:hypothetical protein